MASVITCVTMVRSAARRWGCFEAREGFIAVDALVGLSILAVGLTLAFPAFQVAAAIADRAAQLSRSRILAQRLLLTPSVDIGQFQGSSGALSWVLDTERDGDALGLCRRSVQVRRLNARPVELRSVLWCQSDPAHAS